MQDDAPTHCSNLPKNLRFRLDSGSREFGLRVKGFGGVKLITTLSPPYCSDS